jgi:hypothetical protein
VTGAGEVLLSLRKMFREKIDANWMAARGQITASGVNGAPSMTALEDPADDAGDEDGSTARLTDAGDEEAAVPKDLPPVIVGFAQVPAAGPH